jgi:alginate O-acetyltransferase complex protein AlgJ
MEWTASGLSAFLTAQVPLPPCPPVPFSETKIQVEHFGDITVMMKLPAGQGLFPKEKATIRQIGLPGGQPWRPDPDAGILLLGDSYANIYSQPEMHWGQGAGLAEQLAFELKRPVDRISRNDAGAHATRRMLAQELGRGQDRLKGKTAVIWEFAARELAVGDWKLIELKLGQAKSPALTSPSPAHPAAPTLIEGNVQMVSDRPVKTAPYRDFIMKVYLAEMVDERGNKVGAGDGLVHFFGMRNGVILAAAGIQTGQKARFRIRPWSEVIKEYGSLNSGMLEDLALELKTLYFGEFQE